MAQHLRIQPTLDHVVLYLFIEKKSECKWTHTVQTCVVQGSASADDLGSSHSENISKCFTCIALFYIRDMMLTFGILKTLALLVWKCNICI